MKIAISSAGNDLDSQIDPRFGRALFFIIVDSETMTFEVIDNSKNMNAPGGAGIQTAQNIIDKGVQVIITGNLGPNALKILQTSDIKLITGISGTIRKAVEDFKNQKLSLSE